jgi:hypothetical protein
MTVAELTKLLYDLRVPTDLYRLDGMHFELAHVLAREEARWVVFLSERGDQSDRIEFADEHEACVHLFGRIFLELAEGGQLRVTSNGPAASG